MATETTTADSVSGLAKDIIRDIRDLVLDQFELVRREMGDELKKAGAAGLSLGTGAGATAAGGLFGALAAVYFVHEVFGLPRWVSYAAVGCGLCAAGAGLLTAGVEQASDIDLIPGRPSRERNQSLADRRRPTAAHA